MGTAQVGDVADGLVVPRDTVVHRLPAHPKVVTLLVVVLMVVATPGHAWWAFVGYGLALAGVVAVARLPPATVLRRCVVETPFVVFALLLPLVASGPRVDVLGVSLSQAGLSGGAVLLAKGTLGVVAAIVLAATTTPRDLLGGLDRLRLPRAFVGIVSFMLRYAAVVVSDLRRMRVARVSRCAPEGRLTHLRHEAAGVGALFVRSYERGERVHHAMVARGYTGRLPAFAAAGATPAQWALSAVLPAVVAGLLLAARWPG